MGKKHPAFGRSFRVVLPLLAVVTAGATASCRNVEILKGFEAKLDPRMKKAEREQLVDDAERLNDLRFNASERSFFRLIFQGGEIPSDGVIRYLNERVNYIVGSDANVDNLLQVGPRSYRELKEQFSTVSEPGAPAQEESRGVVMALNLGMAGWWIHETLGPSQGLSIRFAGNRVPLDSSRVGLIQLGPGYTDETIHTVDRLETLVHEGRHSDCTGGLSQQALFLLRNGIPPLGSTCGHSHAACPAGHPLEGLPACDVAPWGAYAVGAVFSVGISRQCENCSEEEKQLAEMSAGDSLSRVDPAILDQMFSGVFGAPDMSSQGVLAE